MYKSKIIVSLKLYSYMIKALNIIVFLKYIKLRHADIYI